jgi:hypothetical protein
MIGNIVALDDRYAALNNRVLEVLAMPGGLVSLRGSQAERIVWIAYMFP